MHGSSKATELKQRISISSVVKKAVQLKGNGPRYLGLCPFHQEKTPSFNVNDKLQRFKCFGCGASGDMFEFVMRLRGLSFNEAYDDIAGPRFSATPRKSTSGQPSKDPTRELLGAQELAHKYFVHEIASSLGVLPRKYLSDRFINPSMIEQAGIGFGGTSSDAFINYLKKNNVSSQLALEAGLVKIQNSCVVPVFLNRIIFPLRRFDGKVIAFGARTLLESSPEIPKYVNTHAYKLYEKRRNLYGLFESKQAILRGQAPVLVEGYFDAMALWALGIPALALCGTALSTEHVSILKRLVSRVIICFDGDQAGFRALRSSLALLWAQNLTATVITLDKKDPGEYLCDLKALQARVDQPKDAFCYVIDQGALRAQKDISSRVGEIDELMPVFANISRPIVRRQYVAYLAKQWHEDSGLLWAEINNRIKNKRKSVPESEKKIKDIGSLNNIEKLLAQLSGQHPDIITYLSEILKAYITPEFLAALTSGLDSLTSPLSLLIKREQAQAAPILWEEALELTKALESKLVRMQTKAQIKQKRIEIQQAEKTKDFCLMLKNLKEQSLILAHHKSPKVTAPEAKKLEPKISKAKAEPKHEYFEEEDWL